MIPIFRAKEFDSGEYVTGFLYQDLICYIPSDGFKPDEYKKAVDTETWFIMDNLSHTSMIDTTTLSIHFPDMLDSQGNKIFASLQEDGKGGDICLCESGVKHLLLFNGFSVVGINTDFFGKFKGTIHNGINKNFIKNTNYKVIGIQE